MYADPNIHHEYTRLLCRKKLRYGPPLRPCASNRIASTAICTSIDHFLHDTAPIFCLPFDRIGAQHLGTWASAGLRETPEWAGDPIAPFHF